MINRTSVLGVVLAPVLIGGGLAVPLVGAAAPASAAEVTDQTCLVADYTYKIRKVTHRAPVWVTYRVNWQPFPFRKHVKRGTTLTQKQSSNVATSAGISGSASVSYNANAIVEKVEAKASVSSDYRRRTGSTKSESRTVSTLTDVTVPAETTLITFRARKVIRGTYQLSTCEHQEGQSVRFGQVVWRTHRWSTYSSAGRGQWTCTAEAQTVPERQAQRIAGCIS